MRELNAKTEKKIQRLQKDDLQKMKEQFARDLKNMIDAEVRKH